MALSWHCLESNPEVLTKYIHKLGASKEWKFVDVFGLDEELLDMVPQPVAALLLVFPLGDGTSASGDGKEIEASQSKSFFFKQTIRNACGTIGLLHSLANSKVPLEEGSVLDKFLKATKDKSPDERAAMLEKSMEIQQSHEGFAQQGQTATPNADAQVDLHFVALVLVDNHVVELDGRKAGPIQHCPATEATFLKDAASVCKKYMTSAPNAVTFSLTALVKSN